MITFFHQFSELIKHGTVHLFLLFFAFIWIVWLAKYLVARKYKPYTEPYWASVSVIIPVVDEPVELFSEVLRRIFMQQPDEIIVVANGAENLELRDVALRYGAIYSSLPHPGKRQAIVAGATLARNDYLVIVDSDTLWDDYALHELMKPFKNPAVGGVTTHQEIIDPDRNTVTRIAAWMEATRAKFSMPAMSALGTVGCLPGRTIAIRKHVLMDNEDEFLRGSFLGYHLRQSDDRAITNYVLKAGYQSVYQRTARVYTDAPTTWRKFIRQQYRWAHGSQYNSLKMLPWMMKHARFLAFLFWSEIVAPFFLLAVWAWVFLNTTHETGISGAHPLLKGAFTALVGASMSLGLRQLWLLRHKPKWFLRVPIFVVFATFIMVPLKLLAFVKMGHDSGWGTRKNAFKKRRLRFNKYKFIPYIIAVVIFFAFFGLGALLH